MNKTTLLSIFTFFTLPLMAQKRLFTLNEVRDPEITSVTLYHYTDSVSIHSSDSIRVISTVLVDICKAVLSKCCAEIIDHVTAGCLVVINTVCITCKLFTGLDIDIDRGLRIGPLGRGPFFLSCGLYHPIFPDHTYRIHTF